jgi:hypothetical protein
MERVLSFVLVALACTTGCSPMPNDSNSPRYYSESIHRDNVERQVTMTPQTLEQLGKYGVTAETNLSLEYFFYANSDSNANSLRLALLDLGYTSEHGPSASDDTMFVITGWTSKMPMNPPTVVDWTHQMCELGFTHDAEFDGWGTNPSQD